MVFSESDMLARFVGSLEDFAFYENIDGNYNHMGATIADAVLQANNKYVSHVKPRVNRILALYPDARTTSHVLHILKSISATDFLSWKGNDRGERFSQIVELFSCEGIENETDLRDWLSKESNLLKLRNIQGVGPKTVDYFKILAGVSTNAIDRHLLKFLKLAGIEQKSYKKSQRIINETADILSIDRAKFDHSIWQYMSNRASY
jgi:hypothetical protein